MNCQWCNVELKNDGEHGVMCYYILFMPLNGLKADKPICPLCMTQFKIPKVDAKQVNIQAS